MLVSVSTDLNLWAEMGPAKMAGWGQCYRGSIVPPCPHVVWDACPVCLLGKVMPSDCFVPCPDYRALLGGQVCLGKERGGIQGRPC